MDARKPQPSLSHPRNGLEAVTGSNIELKTEIPSSLVDLAWLCAALEVFAAAYLDVGVSEASAMTLESEVEIKTLERTV